MIFPPPTLVHVGCFQSDMIFSRKQKNTHKRSQTTFSGDDERRSEEASAEFEPSLVNWGFFSFHEEEPVYHSHQPVAFAIYVTQPITIKKSTC